MKPIPGVNNAANKVFVCEQWRLRSPCHVTLNETRLRRVLKLFRWESVITHDGGRVPSLWLKD